MRESLPVAPRGRWALLLALLAGALLPLHFAPFAWRFLGVLAPALLFWLWRAATPRGAALLGFVFGLGLFGVGASWVQVSFLQFGLPFWMATGVTVLFVTIMSLYPALAGWLGAGFFQRQWWLAFPLLWAASEWLRGWLFTGFNWLNLGGGVLDTPLAPLAPVGGVYLGSLVYALLAVVVVHWGTGPARRRWWAMAPLLLVSLPAPPRVPWSHPAGEPIQVSLVQGNVSQAEKWQPDRLASTLWRYADLTRQHWDSRLIVWPETAVPTFRDRVQERFLAPLEREARTHGSEILLGVPTREGRGPLYNSMVVLGNDQGRYDKRHLVPFGEYLPLGWLLHPLLRVMDIPMSDFSPGDPQHTRLTLAGIPSGISICYEDAYGREVAEALPEARLLVNASNDAWFGHSLAPEQHLEIARLRALEGGRYLLRSTNTGISAIITPDGGVQARSPRERVHVLTAMVTPMAGATPYAYVRDGWLWSILVWLLWLGWRDYIHRH